MQNGLMVDHVSNGKYPVTVKARMENGVPSNSRTRSLDDMKQTITITPTLALEWLEQNTKNRPKRPKKVREYARDMKSGKWKLSGDTIKFDRNGVLLDGQHRLMAVIESDTPIASDVRFGLDPNVFINIDTHIKRQPHDFLSIRGEANSRALVKGVVNALCYIDKQYYNFGHSRYTNDEISEFIRKNPEIRNSVDVGLRLKGIVKSGLAVGLHYLSSRANKKKADLFWKGLIEGSNLSSMSPIRVLREKLISERLSGKKYEAMKSIEIVALIIKAFNAFVQNRAIGNLKWTSQGRSAEPFPTFVK